MKASTVEVVATMVSLSTKLGGTHASKHYLQKSREGSYRVLRWPRKTKVAWNKNKIAQNTIYRVVQKDEDCKKDLKSNLKIFVWKIVIDDKTSKCRLNFVRIFSMAIRRSMKNWREMRENSVAPREIYQSLKDCITDWWGLNLIEKKSSRIAESGFG